MSSILTGSTIRPRLRHTGLLALAASLLAACPAGGARAEELVPGTQVTLDALLLAPGAERNYAKPAAATWPICLDPPHLRAYRASVLTFTAGDSPFAHVAPLTATCAARLIRPSAPTELADARELASERCRLRYETADGALTRAGMQLMQDDEQSFEECSVRLALFALGYNGAATLPSEPLLRPKAETQFAFEASVGSVVPMVVLQQRLACPDVPIRSVTRQALTSRIYCTDR